MKFEIGKVYKFETAEQSESVPEGSVYEYMSLSKPLRDFEHENSVLTRKLNSRRPGGGYRRFISLPPSYLYDGPMPKEVAGVPPIPDRGMYRCRLWTEYEFTDYIVQPDFALEVEEYSKEDNQRTGDGVSEGHLDTAISWWDVDHETGIISTEGDYEKVKAVVEMHKRLQ